MTRNAPAVLAFISKDRFFSYRKRGAQIAEYLHKADLGMFHRINEACGNRVKLIAVAPETEGALDFIEQASKETIVSVAHTCAEYDTAMEAFRRGASHVTHLFKRHGSIFTSCTRRCRRCYGFKCICRTHMRRAAHPSVCDSCSVQNVPGTSGDDQRCNPQLGTAGRKLQYERTVYYHAGTGKTTLPDGTLAGSNITLHDALVNVVRFGIPLEEAVAATTLRPAQSVKVDDEVGSIEPGKRADFVLMDQDLSIQAVYHYGKMVDRNV